MTTLPFDPTQLRVTVNGKPIDRAAFADDALFIVPTPPLKPRPALTITLKSDTGCAAAMQELARADLPTSLVVRDRKRPAKRRHARGGLCRMVRTRLAVTAHGFSMSGGVNEPWTFTAECVQRRGEYLRAVSP